jgi:hypothetical protein
MTKAHLLIGSTKFLVKPVKKVDALPAWLEQMVAQFLG